MKETWQKIVELGELSKSNNRNAATVALFELNSAGVKVLPDMARRLLAIEKILGPALNGDESSMLICCTTEIGRELRELLGGQP